MAPTEVQREMLERRLSELLAEALYRGYVVTVETAPLRPLAMGHYRMVGYVRPARVLDTPIFRRKK
jgi:hypothetical protein